METKNVYHDFVTKVTDVLVRNISTLQTHNNTLDIWTQTNQDLAENWLDGPIPDAITKQWDTAYQDPHNSADLIDQFMKDHCSGNNDMYKLSQAFGIHMMQTMTTHWDDKKSPVQMTKLNQFLSMMSSIAQQEEQPGQSGAKMEGSVVQQDSSAQQPIVDAGTSVSGIVANISSLLQQSY